MTNSHSLAYEYPEIAKEWHPTKNGTLSPLDIGPMSHIKVWWLGSCGHEWDAVVSSRSKGHGCPFCNNLKALAGFNDLATINPELAKEWDYEKNGDLRPENVLPGSHKEVWWLCRNNHSWKRSVKNRNSGNGCPYCTNQRVLAGFNDLATIYPELAKEWDYERNGSLMPDQVLPGAEKKVWWLCEKGHSWDAYIFNRKRGVGCPYCDGKRLLVGFNDLASKNPKLAKEWDYEKNGSLRPEDVISGSHKEVWWLCENKHSWKRSIKERISGRNCPYCTNKSVLIGYNDFATVHPVLAREWSGKNHISPSDIIRGSDKKYYWVCPLGHEDYSMTIDQRLRGQGCPKCAQQSQTSFPEQALYYYIKQLYPESINRYIISKREIDIFIPSKRIGIEYDGYFSHKGKEIKDSEKKAFIESQGITLIRIKEFKKDAEKTNADFYIHERTTYQSITALVKRVLLVLDNEYTLDVDCEKDQVAIKEQYIDSIKEKSIATETPDLLSEWDYDKNGNIKPEFVSSNSGMKYYWICPVCGYSYLSAPASRNRGTGCPACAGKAVCSGFNDLATRNPLLLTEWDYVKNVGIDPTMVFYRSHIKAWWKCDKGHSWEKSIYSRSLNKSKCPYCMGRTVISGFNDLLTKRPDLAKDWDYEMNEGTPEEIHFNNQTVPVHWVCHICGYKWVHLVSNRNRCPECLRKKTQINVYNANDFSLYGHFTNARAFCNHLGIDYSKNQRQISEACRRVKKMFDKRFILRYPIDDEYDQLT